MARAKTATVEGVFGVVGLDSFLAERALESVLDSWVGEDRTEAVEMLAGDEVTWNTVLDAARSGSLFVAKRAVVVRRAESLKGDPAGVAGYLDSPAPGVALILLVGKVDKRRQPWKGLLTRSRVVSAEPKKGQALRRYVVEELRGRDLRLADDGVQELLDRVGQDLRRLMGELDKLEAFGLGKRSLSAEDVSAVLGRGLAQPYYRLGDAVAERQTRRALELMGELLEEGEPAEKILAALHRTLRQTRATLALKQAGVGREEMIERLRLPANMVFKLPGLVAAARRWSDRELAQAISALGQADGRLKLGKDPRVALSAAVVAALGGGTTEQPGGC